MANIVRTGSGDSDVIYDGYTLFTCLIGSKWGCTNGDHGNDRRIQLKGIDMTRIAKMNVSLPRSNGYDYIRILDASSNQTFFKQSAGSTFDIDFSSLTDTQKASMQIEVYSSGSAYLTINSVTKAE